MKNRYKFDIHSLKGKLGRMRDWMSSHNIPPRILFFLLEVITDQPGIQLYTGNGLRGKAVGHGGKPYNYRSGFCLEAEHFPDNPNHSNFPTTILNPGETFKSATIYRFSVK